MTSKLSDLKMPHWRKLKRVFVNKERISSRTLLNNMIIISMPALVAKSAIETLVSKINRIRRNRSILSHLLRLSDTHPLLIGGSTYRSNATIIRSRTAVPLIVAISRELLTILKPWILEEILRNLVNNGWIKTYLSSSNASKQAPLRDFKSIPMRPSPIVHPAVDAPICPECQGCRIIHPQIVYPSG